MSITPIQTERWTATSEEGRSWISKTPGVCGGEPCIRNTRITVSGLVEWRELGATQEWLLAAIEGLTAEDLQVAWEYAHAHSAEIAWLIRENNEA
jgi:uncharacterized protein (DUF433 family)